MLRLWIYVPANTLAGFIPFIPDIHYPACALLGIAPGTSVVIEELLAYPQLFTFVNLFLFWLHEEGIRIWRSSAIN
jgi:hypothetical protein